MNPWFDFFNTPWQETRHAGTLGTQRRNLKFKIYLAAFIIFLNQRKIQINCFVFGYIYLILILVLSLADICCETLIILAEVFILPFCTWRTETERFYGFSKIVSLDRTKWPWKSIVWLLIKRLKGTRRSRIIFFTNNKIGQ